MKLKCSYLAKLQKPNFDTDGGSFFQLAGSYYVLSGSTTIPTYVASLVQIFIAEYFIFQKCIFRQKTARQKIPKETNPCKAFFFSLALFLDDLVTLPRLPAGSLDQLESGHIFFFFPTNPKSCTEKEEKEKRELHEYCIDVGDPSSLVSGQKKSICGKNDLVSSCKAYQPRTNRLHMMPSLSFTSLPCSLSLSLFLLQALTELLLQAFLSCWLPACCISWLFDMIDGF